MTASVRAHQDLGTLLDLLGAPAHLEVLEERLELLRFGESRVTYQHSEERVVVRARIIRDGRAAWGTTTSLDPQRVSALRERLESSISAVPAYNDAELTEPDRLHERATTTRYSATEQATAEDRANLLKRALAAAPGKSTLGGSISHTTVIHHVANTRGMRRCEQRTRAGLQVIATNASGSSFGRALHRDAAQLPVEAVFGEVQRGLGDYPTRSLEPGVYRAVLGPQATITLLSIYAQIALGGRQYQDGASAVSGLMGERVASPAITLIDDGSDPAGLPTSFDCEGIAKRRVPLIEQGILKGVVENTTGHTAPPGWRFGADPIPSHLLVRRGEAEDADLAMECNTGIHVQRVDYVRVLNARQTLVTGSTRDATLWIEGGRVVGRLPQFRFTMRLSELLNSVEATGQTRQRGDTVFMESVVAPAILVSALPVQTVVAPF